MWHFLASYILPCKVVMVIWRNSFHMKYSPFHLLFQNLASSTRLDIVWDTYLTDSLKECTQDKRGKGCAQESIRTNKAIPSKWMDFLCDSKNKEELFAFLTTKVAEVTFPPGSLVYVTSGESVAPSICQTAITRKPIRGLWCTYSMHYSKAWRILRYVPVIPML